MPRFDDSGLVPHCLPRLAVSVLIVFAAVTNHQQPHTHSKEEVRS